LNIPGTTDCNDLKPNSCKFCYVEFDNEEEKNEHEVVHQNESQPYRCPQTSCKSRFKTKNYLKDHFRVHTNERPYSCRFCEIAFKSTSNRSRHEKKSHPREYQIKKLQEIEKGITPKGKQPVEKEVAGNSDETEEQPESNRKVSKRGNKEYSCRFCDKTFRRCDNWRRHEAIQ
jgi:KRAB domain-containing zinc finger protein